MWNLPESLQIVQATSPVTTNAAVSGDYISLKNAVKVMVVVNLKQAVGHATVVSLYQATAVAGTGAKALANAVRIWANEDTAASDTLVAQTDAVNYTVTNDIKSKQIVFEVDPRKLDINNDFDCLQVRTSASSQATNFVSADYYIIPYMMNPDAPSAITD